MPEYVFGAAPGGASPPGKPNATRQAILDIVIQAADAAAVVQQPIYDAEVHAVDAIGGRIREEQEWMEQQGRPRDGGPVIIDAPVGGGSPVPERPHVLPMWAADP